MCQRQSGWVTFWRLTWSPSGDDYTEQVIVIARAWVFLHQDENRGAYESSVVPLVREEKQTVASTYEGRWPENSHSTTSGKLERLCGW